MWWSFRLRPFDWRLTGRRSSFRPHSLETARKLWVASRGCPSSYTTMRHTVLTLPVNSQEKNAISAEEEWIGLPGLKPGASTQRLKPHSLGARLRHDSSRALTRSPQRRIRKRKMQFRPRKNGSDFQG